MDIVKQSIDKYIAGGKALLQDLSAIRGEAIWDQFTNLNWRINTSLLLITFAVVGFATMWLLANVFSDSGPGSTVKTTVNNALGSSSQAINKPGAPPIPAPTEVVGLRVYPIKSCRGFEVTSTRLRKMGLTLDRNWMFITKEDKKFITIRGDASMTLIDTAIVEDKKTKGQMLEISIHGTDARVMVPAFPTKQWLESNTSLEPVEIWEKETDGYIYGDSVNKIFSDFFKKPVALVYKGPTHRMVAVNGSKELYGKETPHHFADVMSLQVASEASIKDLNRRLKEKLGPGQEELTIERFRPNIIVRGRDDEPWEEDTWKRIRITTTLHEEEAIYVLDLDAVARCARCQVPNVNPETAEKNPKEPWDEMMKFRRVVSYLICMNLFPSLSNVLGCRTWVTRRSGSPVSACFVFRRTKARSKSERNSRSWKRPTIISSIPRNLRTYRRAQTRVQTSQREAVAECSQRNTNAGAGARLAGVIFVI